MRPSWRLRMPASWPPPARRWALGMIAIAGSLDVLLVSRSDWQPSHLSLFAALMVCGTAVTVAQRWFGAPTKAPGEADVDLQSVWIFACALLLPPVYGALAPALLEVSAPLGSRDSGPVNRLLNIASLSVSGAAASVVASRVAGVDGPAFGRLPDLGLVTDWRLLAGVALAVAVFTGLNAASIGEMIHRNHGVRRLAALGGWTGIAVELAVQCTGALLAAAWAVARPLGALSLPPLVLLQRSLLHTQLLAAARTDAKTGLVNSTHWRQLAETHLRRATAATAPLAVALIDLDHFKRVNDAYGHLVGDDVLVATAEALAQASRPGDVVGRFGGEEFAVLLPGLSTTEAAVVGDRLRAAIAAMATAHSAAGLRVTASVGIATLGEHGPDLDILLRAADLALYAAKAAGRDRVRVATPLDDRVDASAVQRAFT